MRRLSTLVLILAVGCSSKAPPSTSEAALRTSPSTMTASTSPLVSPPGATATATRSPDPREAALAEAIVHLLEREHLLRKKLTDDVSREAFENFLTRLDASKMFLLKADRDALARHADQIDDELHDGSLELAHEGARRYAARIPVVEQMVAGLLAAPFDHTDEEWIEVDPEKFSFAATEDELRDRWRRRLELEVLDRVASMEARLDPKRSKNHDDDDDDDDASTLPRSRIPKTPEGRDQKAREDLAKAYAGRFARLRTPGPLDAAADLVNAVATVLDPHTTYLPPADKANFDIHMSGSLEGIGAVLRERDHYVEVVELVPGGAAWRQGRLGPGDVILAVTTDGKEPVDTLDMRIDEVVKMIRGPKGTTVRLQIQKPTGVEESVAITRDVVVIEEAYARGAVVSKKGGPTYGYIHVPSFYGGQGKGKRSAGEDVRKLLVTLDKKKVAGVILDLRSNGGGILGDAIDMTGHFIDKGPVVQVQDSRGKREVHEDEDAGVEYRGPVVVMVDRFSASASEIVAAALQDYRRAVIVGTGPTHGKGTVQTIADLDRLTGGRSDLGVLKITIQQFFRVTGASTQQRGVVPDIVLPDPAGHVETGERELDHAIAWSQIPAVDHDKWSPTWSTTGLAQRSALRVAKHPILGKIATTTEFLRARQNDTRVPLARPAWEKRRTELRTAVEAASPDLTKAAPMLQVTPLAEPPAPTAARGPNGKTDDRASRWRDSLARDPWVDESLNILGDMARK